MATYPQRGNFFCHRAIRRLIKSCAIQEIGATAYALVTVVAHQEDSKRYTAHVTYFNGQLMHILGLSSVDSLARARKKAVDAGWLHYEPGGKGKAGRYWVLIPEYCEALDDSPCDESDDDFSVEFSTASNGRKAAGKPKANTERSRREADGKPESFVPTPSPPHKNQNQNQKGVPPGSVFRKMSEPKLRDTTKLLKWHSWAANETDPLFDESESAQVATVQCALWCIERARDGPGVALFGESRPKWTIRKNKHLHAAKQAVHEFNNRRSENNGNGAT